MRIAETLRSGPRRVHLAGAGKPDDSVQTLLNRVDLQAWRGRVQDLPVGAALAAALEQRPRRVDPNDSAAYRDVPSLWANTLVDSLAARQRLISHLQARQVADLAELSGNYPGVRQFLTTEIGFALGIAESTAQSQLCEAAQLVHRLPSTFAAMDSGHLTREKAAVISQQTVNVSDAIAAAVEHEVLPRAAAQTRPQLRESVQRAIIRCDPAGAEERHEQAARQRYVSRCNLPDGMAGLWFTSTAQDIATVWEAMTALADASRVPGDDRTLDARRVDSLVDVCANILDSGHWQNTVLPTNRKRRPHVQITVPIDVLTGSQSPCDLAGYGPVTAGQGRAIAADATLQRLVCDPLSGTLLDLGRERYKPPESLAEFVIVRDQTCVVPGCRQPAWRCEVDHRVPFRPGRPSGGPTSAGNLACLCKHHHLSKDGFGFTLSRDPDGTHRVITPLGRVKERPPTRLWHPPDPLLLDRPAATSAPSGQVGARLEPVYADPEYTESAPVEVEHPGLSRTSGSRPRSAGSQPPTKLLAVGSKLPSQPPVSRLAGPRQRSGIPDDDPPPF